MFHTDIKVAHEILPFIFEDMYCIHWRQIICQLHPSNLSHKHNFSQFAIVRNAIAIERKEPHLIMNHHIIRSVQKQLAEMSFMICINTWSSPLATHKLLFKKKLPSWTICQLNIHNRFVVKTSSIVTSYLISHAIWNFKLPSRATPWGHKL